jgi:hypothetical protein
MGYSLSYFEDAKKDMKDAKAWYKDRSVGLDKRFQIQVQETFKPESFLPRKSASKIYQSSLNTTTFTFNNHY